MQRGPLRLSAIIPRPQTEDGLVRRSPQGEGGWELDDLAGRLVEISSERSSAQLTAAFGLVLEAQLCGDRAAWVTFEHSAFFPPDAAAGGVDVESLPVVRIPNTTAAARAAEHLVRSGGFGLVVLDLSSAPGVTDAARGARAADAARGAASQALPVPMLTRLLGLARTHHAAVLVLTRKSPDTSSLNSLISLRADAQRSAREGGYDVRIRVLKDKRRAPGWDHVETCRGSAGLR
jgi:recombination protein RecA